LLRHNFHVTFLIRKRRGFDAYGLARYMLCGDRFDSAYKIPAVTLTRPASSLFGRSLAAQTSNLNHVAPIYTHILPAFSACITGFFSGELVGNSFAMGRHTAFSRDLALFTSVHRRKTTCLISDFHRALLSKDTSP